ncbi:LysR family transcriptional regulator [Streptomyces sp. N2-109]|uniref:LysR family transcriptional regulator n=1 Tax=Streptomyces gossypii TaxID=2883101 RepID=A0ABT2K3H8_9ACTN|nr:LysR family transcriptional regulator [Streptomyces gossypii]MCT2594733.1 LysR family transcriptional regulator [Streptomyces gossypii]
MQLHQLRAFREVARLRSFTRAAQHLHYAQSSVTAQIQNLEEIVGAPLFDRGGRRIALTEAGRCLLPYAEQVLTLVETARHEVAAVAAGGPCRRPGAQAPTSHSPAARPPATRAAPTRAA